MEDKQQPIVIKKINVAAGHHGGSWKVAFADFATAMMAFFMLLWILAVANQDERAAISDFFNNPSLTPGKASIPAPGQQGPGGASTSMIKLGGATDLSRGEGKRSREQGQAEEQARKQDAKRLKELQAKLQQAIESNEALKRFKDQLKIDITPEGLRVQILDKENRPMFASGSDRLKEYAAEILLEIGKTINTVPNRISLTGHTDATSYVGRDDYSNWELSADRANAARRALLEGGMDRAKIGRVVGLADSELFNQEDPRDPINRRIAIIIMNRDTAKPLDEKSAPAMEGDGQAPEAATETETPVAEAPGGEDPLGDSRSAPASETAEAAENADPETAPAPVPASKPAPGADSGAQDGVKRPRRLGQGRRIVIDPSQLRAPPPANDQQQNNP